MEEERFKFLTHRKRKWLETNEGRYRGLRGQLKPIVTEICYTQEKNTGTLNVLYIGYLTTNPPLQTSFRQLFFLGQRSI